MQLLGGLCHMPFDEAVGSLNGKTASNGRGDVAMQRQRLARLHFRHLSNFVLPEKRMKDLTLKENWKKLSSFGGCFFLGGGMVKGRVGVGFVMFCDICFNEMAFMILEKMVDSMILCWL